MSRAEWFIILIRNIKTNISAKYPHILVCLGPRYDMNLDKMQNDVHPSKFQVNFDAFWTFFFQAHFVKNFIGEHPVFSLLIK